MFSKTIYHRTTFSPFIQYVFIFTYIKSKRVTAPRASNWINIPKLFCFVYIFACQLFCTFTCLPDVAAISMARCGKHCCQPSLLHPTQGLLRSLSLAGNPRLRKYGNKAYSADVLGNTTERVLQQGGNAAQRLKKILKIKKKRINQRTLKN